MPRAGLERIDSLELAQVSDHIKAINPRPFFKFAMVYETPWYGDIRGRSVADTPIRQAYHWGTDPETGKALVMTYRFVGETGCPQLTRWVCSDGITVESWQVFSTAVGQPMTHEWAAVKAPDTMVEEQHRQFCEIHGVDPKSQKLPLEVRAASCCA